MNKFLISFLFLNLATAAEVEVKVLKTISKTKPQEKKQIEKELSKKINRPKASGTSQL